MATVNDINIDMRLVPIGEEPTSEPFFSSSPTIDRSDSIQPDSLLDYTASLGPSKQS